MGYTSDHEFTKFKLAKPKGPNSSVTISRDAALFVARIFPNLERLVIDFAYDLNLAFNLEGLSTLLGGEWSSRLTTFSLDLGNSQGLLACPDDIQVVSDQIM